MIEGEAIVLLLVLISEGAIEGKRSFLVVWYPGNDRGKVVVEGAIVLL